MRKLHTCKILGFYVKMNHFEAHSMVSSRAEDSKVLRVAIQLSLFF